jgi:hypothetical protein
LRQVRIDPLGHVGEAGRGQVVLHHAEAVAADRVQVFFKCRPPKCLGEYSDRIP